MHWHPEAVVVTVRLGITTSAGATGPLFFICNPFGVPTTIYKREVEQPFSTQHGGRVVVGFDNQAHCPHHRSFERHEWVDLRHLSHPILQRIPFPAFPKFIASADRILQLHLFRRAYGPAQETLEEPGRKFQRKAQRVVGCVPCLPVASYQVGF